MTAETRLTHLGLVETAKGIASGAFSSEEVARACIQRIGAAQPHLNCFIRLQANEALETGKAADSARGVLPRLFSGLAQRRKLWKGSGGSSDPLDHGVSLGAEGCV